MKRRKDTAFPGIKGSHAAWDTQGNVYTAIDVYKGMTLRDYFAARAMAELVKSKGSQTWKCKARRSYMIADAMLKARSE